MFKTLSTLLLSIVSAINFSTAKPEFVKMDQDISGYFQIGKLPTPATPSEVPQKITAMDNQSGRLVNVSVNAVENSEALDCSQNCLTKLPVPSPEPTRRPSPTPFIPTITPEPTFPPQPTVYPTPPPEKCPTPPPCHSFSDRTDSVNESRVGIYPCPLYPDVICADF